MSDRDPRGSTPENRKTEGPDAASERESRRDGLLSYAAEWHAFTHGVSDGSRTRALGPKDLPDNPDVEKEPHYYKGGYIIGTLLQLAILILFVYGGSRLGGF